MKTILAAMSGGVDSAVACLCLQNAGYLVRGGTMLVRDGGQNEAEDAKMCAERLGIEFEIFDWRKEFEHNVIKPFADTYRAGETPNPCIFCNKTMKFGLLLDAALARGCDGIATGHYARVEYDAGSGRYLLKTAKDTAKDQTYMLAVLDQHQLSHTVLPLGGLTKIDARQLAFDAGLPVALKHDSQDICFVPDGDYMAYLTAHGFVPQAGHFVGTDGTDYGPHRGMEAYTVGQRRGLELAFGSRMYVLGKRGTDVVLGTGDLLMTDTVFVRDMNWIPFAQLTQELRCEAKLRYSTKTAPCTVSPTEDGCMLHFDTPQRAPTPGQLAVLYDGDTVLGAGTITKETEKERSPLTV